MPKTRPLCLIFTGLVISFASVANAEEISLECTVKDDYHKSDIGDKVHFFMNLDKKIYIKYKDGWITDSEIQEVTDWEVILFK